MPSVQDYKEIDAWLLPIMERMHQLKVCKCGAHYPRVPESATLGGEDELHGFYWNCICRSTLFVPIGDVL